MRFRRADSSTFQSYQGRHRPRTTNRNGPNSNKGRVITAENPEYRLRTRELSLFPGSVQETHYFQFFRTVTASSLAGVFDFGFWTCDTLQVSHLYPALWHATTALGAVHVQLNVNGALQYSWPSKAGYHGVFALEQCLKSIRSLKRLTAQQELSEQDRIVVLTTCILFSCLSALEGYQEQAFMHIHSGLKLIRDWQLEEVYLQQPGNHMSSMLLLMFNQLDTQGRSVRQGLMTWTNAVFDKRDKSKLTIPCSVQNFTSCLQAYIELERLINGFSHIGIKNEDESGADSEQTVAQWKQVYSHALAAWDTRFNSFLASTSERISENMMILLRIRYIFTSTLFHDPCSGELGYDEFIHQFTTIVNFVERILEPRGAVTVQQEEFSSSQNPIHPHVNISLSTIISDPLLFIAMRCREPNTRHRALRMLKKYPRREGVVNTILATNLLERMISFEEKSCPKSKSCPDDDSSTGPGTCSAGRWICGNHRVSFQEFLALSHLGEQSMQKWYRCTGDSIFVTS